MKRVILISLAMLMMAGIGFGQTLLVDEPFASTGLAYTWDDLASVDDYLPQIVTAASVGISDQDADGYLGAMPQPSGSTINSYYVPGTTDNIVHGKAVAWIYVQQSTSTTSTVYMGVVGRSEATIDPGYTYMYRCIWRSNNQLIRCQSYSTYGWNTIANTDLITTEGWHLITLDITGLQVDGYDGANHFASANDTTTVQTDLGTLWGLYAYAADNDWLYCDDVKIYENPPPAEVKSWDLY